jgi:hypothetical protein
VQITRLLEGQTLDAPTTVCLFHGFGDSRREVEWFTTEGVWVVPATVNGFWYGIVYRTPRWNPED